MGRQRFERGPLTRRVVGCELHRGLDDDNGHVVATARGERCLDEAVAYTKERKQFGTAIANFQVLQHRMVDMFMNVEQSVSMTYMATIKLEESDAERAKAVSAAKVRIGRACKFVGQNAIQIHGGMGMTDELAVSHYFKRASMIEQLFGGVDYHLNRYESLDLAAA